MAGFTDTDAPPALALCHFHIPCVFTACDCDRKCGCWSVQHEIIKKVVAGKEIEVRKQLWGGTRNGVLVGASRYYMGPDFYGRNSALGTPAHTAAMFSAPELPAENVPGFITLTFFLGGGGISAQELQFADEYGAPWVYIPCP
eukprot:1161769-Pelagomonas_calceolata.AAC.2